MKVKQQQHLLGYLGYYSGQADGIWGKLSKSACRAFQADYGLADTGICDAATEQMLLAAIAGTAVKVEKPGDGAASGKSTGTFWDSIRYFRRDEDGIPCPCGRCGGYPVEPTEKLMRTADSIRQELGPMTPSSTVRCQAHNDELPGSAKNSRHIIGRAMDFACPKSGNAQVEACLAGKKAAGEIRYWYAMGSGWYHFDVE